MSRGLQDLRLWQEAVALAGDILRAARQSNTRETRAFHERLARCACDVGARIAEGYATEPAAEQQRSYRQARHALGELETLLAVARHATLLPPATIAQCSARIQAVTKLLASYIAYVDRQVGVPATPEPDAAPSAAPSAPSG